MYPQHRGPSHGEIIHRASRGPDSAPSNLYGATAWSFPEDVDGTVHLRGTASMYAGVHQHADSYPEHIHSFLEIVLVTSGSGTHNSRFGRSNLQEGDALVIQPGIAHAYTDCHHLEVLNCGISLALLDRELKWTVEDPLLGVIVDYDRSPGAPVVLQARLEGSRFTECVAALRRLEACGSSTVPSDSIAYLLLFLGQVARGAAGRWHLSSVNHLPPMMREAASLLKDNLGHSWTLTELAARLHMSPSHLARQFSATMGEPPLAYLSRQRAEAAGRRLLASNLPIARIGAEVGWTDANHFARRFKKYFGMSPTEYRERSRVLRGFDSG